MTPPLFSAAPGGRTVVDELRARGLHVEADARRLAEYSYDASNYRVRPLAVVFPRTAADVREALESCRFTDTPLVARGGGTSMAGNAIGPGVVLDLSRHLTGIRHLDGEARTIDVDPGVVLATLTSHVEQQTAGQLTFAPDPSSRTRCTVGGSIGNDACGNHSVRYGRMSDHVVEIDVVTTDGALLTAARGGVRATDPADEFSARRATELTDSLTGLVDRYRADLRTELGRIPRQVSGFHLNHLLPEEGFDVARALVGSEGSCAVVVGARMRLVERPPSALLICLGYDDIVEAARDVPRLLQADPAAVEGIDERIVETMRWRRGTDSVTGLPGGHAWLFVDLDGSDAAEVRSRAQLLLSDLLAQGRVRDGRIVADPRERESLWRVREDGAGLSARLAPDSAGVGSRESWPGWEDSAVAPHRLADYIADLRVLLGVHELDGVMYGHFGAGCVHIRITFDLHTKAGVQNFRDFTTDAARLVVKHGGSLSGEHGDGRARSELLPIMYSPRIMSAFNEFRHIWDPSGVLSVAGIADPSPITEDLALADMPARRWDTALAFDGPPTVDGFVHAVQGCIGVGRCRSTTGGVMCPSYRATGDEKDSTRGRARVLQDMVRTASTTNAGWRSPEAIEALDLCLACKACSTDCPTGVGMATLKSEFLYQHYRHRPRPRSHYVLGWLPLWLRAAQRTPGIANRLLASKVSKVGMRAAGLTNRRALPPIAERHAWAREVREGGATQPGRTDGDVVLFVDTFTKAFRPEVAGSVAAVMSASGDRVECSAEACCGLTWLSTGQLGTARRRLNAALDVLDDGTSRPIIVPEPSCAAALRHDLPRLLATNRARSVAARVYSFAAYADALVSAGRLRSGTPAGREALVQVHCHEYATFGADAQHRVLAAAGITTVRDATGCCGVAGHFGFEAEHADLSMRVAEQSLAPALRVTSETTPVLTDGFSCSMQVRQLTPARTPIHLAQLLDPRPHRPKDQP